MPWRKYRRFWLNAPYSDLAAWLALAAQHGSGTALVFARTETDAFFSHIWEQCSAVRFIRGRLHFHYPDALDWERCSTRPHEWILKRADTGAMGCKWCGMAKANSGAPSVLCAFGARDAEALACADIEGRFVPLLIPRGVLVQALSGSWSELVGEWFRANGDRDVSVAELFEAFHHHPKTRENRNVRAKLRQTLRRVGYMRVGRGRYRAPDRATTLL